MTTGDQALTRQANRLCAATLVAICLPVATAAATQAEEHAQLSPRPIAPEPHPFTAEPGTFQLEISPLSFAYDRHNPERSRTRSQSFDVPVLFKAGLTDSMDIQFGMDFVLWDRVREEGQSSTDEGVSDLTVRLKYNLFGNDGETDVAMALLPFMVLPIGSDSFGERGIRGGMILPIEWGIDDDWTINFAPSAAAVRDSENDDLELEVAGLFTLTRAITEELELWAEFEASATTESGDRWIGTTYFGATHTLDTNTAVDLALGFGVTRSADDFSVALTLVRRF